ncbi:uncharacterized protein LOC125672255 isoform X3 [Ostrea edulis]|uniref:uncharacterized protein LOC125672255 isoform X3 n=1 Tax=Ostrea edulis TaxID=37623 RepID=UPI0024AE9FB6|nr:uncharacterized protein LOC125672255 isoform X3 [Ostrea edulis]
MASTTIRILPRRAGSEPLDITVFSNSPAEGELQRGDVILAINGRDASTLTHKQAQDGIKHCGGQVELLVSRPPSGASVKPLQPQSPTRAPQLPVNKTASIQIPIRRSSDHGPKTMPPPAVAGHQPKKITMNKFGGGVTNFGNSYGARAMQPGWSPQPSIYSQQYTPQPSMQEREATAPQFQPQQYQPPPQQQYQQYQSPPQQQQYHSPQQQYHPPQQQYQPPPQQLYQPQQSPRSPQAAQYQPYSLNQPQKTSVATFSPSTPTSQYISPGLSQPDYVRSDDPIDDEVDYEYVPVSQRRTVFKDKQEKQPQMNANGADDDYYYPNCPVWERRKMFMRDQPRVNRSGRRRTYGSPGGGGSMSQFGTDYSKGPTPAAVTVQQRPRPPPVTQVPVNIAPVSHDEPDTSSFSKGWSGTLKSSGGPRPWEQEKTEYVMPSLREPEQQQTSKRPAPAVSPKPSRSPQPRKPAPSPQRQIVVRSVPNDEAQQEQPPQEGAKAVHLQYNSPMGLYSNQNIEDTYNAQIAYPGQNPTSSTATPQPKQGQYFGTGVSQTMFVVDDSDDYLYKLLSEHKHLVGKVVEKNMAPKASEFQHPVTQYVPIAQIPVQQHEVESMSEERPTYSKVEPPVRVTPVDVLDPQPAPLKPVIKPVKPPKENRASVGQESLKSEERTPPSSKEQHKEVRAPLQVNETPPLPNKVSPNVNTEPADTADQSIGNKDISSHSSNINTEKNIELPSDISNSSQSIHDSSLNNEKLNTTEDASISKSSENIPVSSSEKLGDSIDINKAESTPAILLKSSEDLPISNDTETVCQDPNKVEQTGNAILDESSTKEIIEGEVDTKSESVEVTDESKSAENVNEEVGKDTGKIEELDNQEQNVEKPKEQESLEVEKRPSDDKDIDETIVETNDNIESLEDMKDEIIDVVLEQKSMIVENIALNVQVEEVNVQAEEINTQTGEVNTQTGEVNTQRGEVNTQRGEVNVQAGEVNVQVGEVNVQAEEINAHTREVNVQAGEVNVQTGEVNVQEEEVVCASEEHVEVVIDLKECQQTSDPEVKSSEVVKTPESDNKEESTNEQQTETPAEEVRDQQAREEETGIKEDAAEAGGQEEKKESESMDKKPNKKERLDLSQFKQEKKAPGKLNVKQWQTN